MKKSLVALAVVGLFSAPAFAAGDSVSVYGLIDAGLANISNTGQRSQTLVVSGGLQTSRLGFKASEDLGDGLSAIAQVEYALDIAGNNPIGTAAAGSTAQARQQLVGLSSASTGTVVAGYLQTTGFDFGKKFDPAADSSVSAVQNITNGSNSQFLIGANAAASRVQRALAYISPSFSGVTVAVNYVTALGAAGGGALGNLNTASTAPDNNATATLASISYDQGPLSLEAVYGSISSPATAAALYSLNNEKEYALGASYDFGVAKLLASYQATHNDGAAAIGNTDHLYSISGVIPAGGAGAVALSYAHATIGTDTSGNSNPSSYTGAFLHPMGKTLTAYVAYSHVSNGSASAAYSVDNSYVAGGTETVGGSSSIAAIGLSKKF